VQAEGAHTELVLPTGDAERRLVLVRRADAELVVARSQVELGEEAGTTSLVDELIHVWQRFHGRLRDGIEAAIILAEPPGAIGLTGKDDGRSMASTGGDNPSILQERGHLAPAFIEFALRPPFHRTRTGHRVRAGVNPELEVGPPVRRQAGGRAGQNVSEFVGHGDKLRGIPVVRGKDKLLLSSRECQMP